MTTPIKPDLLALREALEGNEEGLEALEAVEDHVRDVEGDLASLRESYDAQEEDAADIDDLKEKVAQAIKDHVARAHAERRHPGAVRFCREQGCDGWDLIFKDLDLGRFG